MASLFLLGDGTNVAPKILNPPYEKKIVVTIASYNNEKFFKKNLESIFFQNYTNYRVIYVDDASTDNTFKLVSEFIEERGFEDKITLIHNKKNKGAMCNHYTMGHLAESDEIIVTVDGDDWLPNKNVFKRLNEAYHDEAVWMTYGSYKGSKFKTTENTPAVPFLLLRHQEHRKHQFIWMHLRTYYAALFKKIPLSAFIDPQTDTFYSMACDVAIMINLIDLAGEHVYMIPEIVYIYNERNAISDYVINNYYQRQLEFSIKQRRPLQKLSSLEEVFH